jgi:hypothetical protein
VSGLAHPSDPGNHGNELLPSEGEPVAHLARHPGKIEVHLPSLGSLFDRTSPPSYPHTGPMVERSIAKFLLDSAREDRRRSEVAVVFAIDGPPQGAVVEAAARSQVNRFFANEAELAALDLRVSRSEGLGSLQYAIPLVAVALLIAGLFYSQLGSVSGAGYLDTLSYLVFITVVWVMLWDPLEVLLFDSYFTRRRLRALRKLAAASITFEYATGSGSPSATSGA